MAIVNTTLTGKAHGKQLSHTFFTPTPISAVAFHPQDEFVAMYNLFRKQKQDIIESQFKKKCTYIDNVFTETGNTIDYIEKLYTA